VYGTLKSNSGSSTSVVRTAVVVCSAGSHDHHAESQVFHEDEHAESLSTGAAAGRQEARRI
jgi:hypothetical protein